MIYNHFCCNVLINIHGVHYVGRPAKLGNRKRRKRDTHIRTYNNFEHSFNAIFDDFDRKKCKACFSI